MIRRGVSILAVAGVATLALFSAQAGGQGSSTPAAGATPGATPAASPAASPVAVDELRVVEGKALAQSLCITCHTVDGKALVGPTWKGLYGRTVELEGGSTVTADDAYLHESIVDPMAKIVKGYPPAMAPYGTLLTDEQIQDIIEYIKTLQ